MRRKPWLLLQVPALIGALTWRALRLARNVDLVHAHWVFPSGLAGIIASRMATVPMVVTSHGGDLNLAARIRLLRPLVRATVGAAQHCIGVSCALLDQFKRYGVTDTNLSRIPYGTAIQPRPRTQAESRDAELSRFADAPGLRILYVGSLIPRKSVATLIEALEVIQSGGKPATAAIVGAGPELDRLREQAQSASVDVRLVGERTPSAIPAWLSAAEVLVLPSRSEGRPLVILEALAIGRAVIATDIDGTRELVRHGVTGFLFPVGDAQELALHLSVLAESRDATARMGEHSLAWFRSEGLSAAAIARRHMDLYGLVLKVQRASAEHRGL